MPLDHNLVVGLLIEYDVENPQTLGEMADRRRFYADRLVAMSKQAEDAATVRKHYRYLGDGVATDYILDNPCHSTHVIVQAFIGVSGQELLNLPDITKDTITYHFNRPIQPHEVVVMITG